jgi:hypothetical protein
MLLTEFAKATTMRKIIPNRLKGLRWLRRPCTQTINTEVGLVGRRQVINSGTSMAP